jgi:hypothetical protein
MHAAGARPRRPGVGRCSGRGSRRGLNPLLYPGRISRRKATTDNRRSFPTTSAFSLPLPAMGAPRGLSRQVRCYTFIGVPRAGGTHRAWTLQHSIGGDHTCRDT